MEQVCTLCILLQRNVLQYIPGLFNCIYAAKSQAIQAGGYLGVQPEP